MILEQDERCIGWWNRLSRRLVDISVIFSLHTAGISSVLRAINFTSTVLNMRQTENISVEKVPLSVRSVSLIAFLVVIKTLPCRTLAPEFPQRKREGCARLACLLAEFFRHIHRVAMQALVGFEFFFLFFLPLPLPPPPSYKTRNKQAHRIDT